MPAARADDGDPAANAPGPWDDVVFLPESGLSVLLERDPRGVLLDRASYLDLHRRARAARGGASSLALPGAMLLRSETEGTVAGDQAHLTVRLTVAARGPGRESVPLGLSGSVVSATLDGKPATLGADAKGGLVLAVAGEGVHDAVVEIVAPVVRKQGVRELAVALPDAAASRWTLDVPGRVSVAPGAGLRRTERLTGPDRTRLVAYGPADLRASWREGDQGTDLPPLVRGEVRTLVEVGERSLDAIVLLKIECSRSPTDRVAVTLPADLTVLGVDGEDASLVPTEGAPGAYTLRFAEPFTGTRTVLIRTSRALAGPGASALPVVDLPDAATVERLLAVRFKDGLRGFVEPGAGVVRMDPATSQDGAVDALLRVERGAAPSVRSERPAVQLRADLRALLDLADDGPWLAVSILYLPRGDRLYGVDPLLPAGFLPETVTVSPDRAFLRGTTPDGRLTLVFPGGVADGGAVTVTVRGRWPAPGWTDEDARERKAPLPRLDAGTVAETDGWLGVVVPPGVEVREEETAGLVPAPVSELRERAGYAQDGLTLGWRFRGASPGGRLAAVRAEATVTSAVVLLVSPAEDHVTLEGLVTVTVQRSGIREARIRVVPGIGDLLRVEGADVAEKRRETVAGADVWIVRLGRLVRDGTVISLRAELPLADHAAAVPAVSLEGAARQELLVGVAAAGELDVRAEAAHLRDADAADFAGILGPGAAGLLRAWKGERDATPTLVVRTARLPASPLPAAFADDVRLTTVLGMDRIARTRLDARVRNADRQALEVTLPPRARLSSARVAGEAVKPVRTAAGVLLVPIVPSAEPFDVALIYEEAVAEDDDAATLGAPDLGIPGTRAVWTVHLPEGSVPIDASGDFSSPPVAAGTPWCLRVLEGITSPRFLVETAARSAPGADEGDLTFGKHFEGAAGPAPAAQPAPPAAPKPQEEAPAMDEDGETRSKAPAKADAPSPDASGDGASGAAAAAAAERRIRARAAQRGLFGMDVRLLAAGPAITATRLGPTGSLHLRWRGAAGRTTSAVVAAIAALLLALLARRLGIGAPTWTLLALAALTAAPIVFATVDTSAADGAAAATALYAFVAAVVAVVGRVGRAVRRWRGGAALAAFLAVALVAGGVGGPLVGTARADDAKAPADPPGRVYVPYDPQRPETLRTPERVFLAYDRYRELWNVAHPEERIDAVLPPVVVAAAYEGKVEDGALVVAARYEVDPVDGGVVALPPGAAVDALKVDGRPASATSAAPGGATLVPVAKGAAAGARVVVEATLRWPVVGNPPGGMVKAPIPRAPRCSLVLDLPLADAVVRLASAGGWTSAPSAAGTRVTAEIGAVDVLDVSWQPRGADAAGGRTRFEVETAATARIARGVVEWSADVVLRVLAGSVEEIEAPLAAGLDVQSVSGPAVASWTVVGGALRVRLVGASAGETKLAVAGIVHVAAGDTIAVPDLAFRGAAAERVRVSVSADEGRLAVVESAGVERTDADPKAPPGTLAFRRVRPSSRLTVRVEPFAADLVVTSRQHLHLGADASLLRAEFDLVPGPLGLFEAVVALPAGWTLDDAAGATTFPETGRVRLVFDGAPRATRNVALRLRGPAFGSDAAPFPVLRVEGATRETADLLVSTAPGFAAAVVDAKGLDPVPADRFAQWPALAVAETRTLAWHDPRGGGSVSLRRDTLRPSVRPTVVADLTVLDDRVIVDALVAWDVRGGVERTFRVDVPAGVVDAWVLGDGLREVRREMKDGRERLTVTLQAATTGTASFRVLYDVPVGADGTVDVTGPVPVGGEGARAFLLVRALGESEVQIQPAAGLETCDVADLPLIPAGLDPLTVLRFLRARDAAWRLPLRLVAHQLGDLPEARIHLVEATTVADRDGSARTRADVRLFNRARAFLGVRLPAGADLETVLVAGRPIRPVADPAAAGVVLVPVRVQSLGEESQVVSLTYRTPPVAPGERFGTFEPRLPEFVGVAVDTTTWRLLLPADRDYSFSGNMDEVEEMEVAIARAEAYASDVQRLRTVVAKGSKQQQSVAIENLVANTREMQESLDFAQSKLGDLERAASEGKVDRARLAQSRQKAQELAKEIEAALADVQQNAPAQTVALVEQGDDVNVDRTAELRDQIEAIDNRRLGTRAGQADKKWRANNDLPQGQPPAVTAGTALRLGRLEAQQAGSSGPSGKGKDGGKARADDESLKALEAHDAFAFERISRDPYAPPTAEGPGTPGGGPGGPTTGGGAGGPSVNRTVGIGGGPGGRLGGRGRNGGGVGGFRYGASGGGGGGAGAEEDGGYSNASWGTDAAAPGTLGYRGLGYVGSGGAGAVFAPPVQGLISLTPPLVEQGRAYSFRKLDAAAEITVSTRTPDLGRRLGVAAGFLVLAGAVWALRRRRARRTARGRS